MKGIKETAMEVVLLSAVCIAGFLSGHQVGYRKAKAELTRLHSQPNAKAEPHRPDHDVMSTTDTLPPETPAEARAGAVLCSSALFGVIYCDPPWRYNFPGTRSESVKDYPTMSVQDLCSLKVPAAKDSVLYMWAITQSLPEAMQVMNAWGYKYKSSAVWDKEQVATGYWWRGQHELLLVGVRGNAKPPPEHLRKSSVIRQRRGSHSSKPDQVRQWIAEWYPNERKLEMFARPYTEMWPKHDGWETWCNELPNDVAMTPNADVSRSREQE